MRRVWFILVLGWPSGAIAQVPITGASNPSQSEVVTVTNIIPFTLSNEDKRDSEPSLALNANNPLELVVSTLTHRIGGIGTDSPVFYSSDGGDEWDLRYILPVEGQYVNDATVKFADDTLYSGLMLPTHSAIKVLRSHDPEAGSQMGAFYERDQGDQPYVAAGLDNDQEYIYTGFNDKTAENLGGPAQTASLVVASGAASYDRAVDPPLLAHKVGDHSVGTELPPIRTAVHNDGIVYVAMYANKRCSWGDDSSVIVARDDNWGLGVAGGLPFGALLSTIAPPACFPSSSAIPIQARGIVVESDLTVPGFLSFSSACPSVDCLGSNELRASALSIAVHPTDPGQVWVAWADTLHDVQHLFLSVSKDSAQSWGTPVLSVDSATNPAVAIDVAGRVGFLFQRFDEPSSSWETILKRSQDDGNGPWLDLRLAVTPDVPSPNDEFFLGDYADLIAHDGAFYGVFSAWNTPITQVNHPSADVFSYRRKALVVVLGGEPVPVDEQGSVVDPSIDPYFFSVEPAQTAVILQECLWPECQASATNITLPVCSTIPCGVVDPIQDGCWNAPTCCSPFSPLCPDWHHATFEGLSDAWKVRIRDSQGNPVKYIETKVGSKLVLTFRPPSTHNPSTAPYRAEFLAETTPVTQHISVRKSLEVSDSSIYQPVTK